MVVRVLSTIHITVDEDKNTTIRLFRWPSVRWLKISHPQRRKVGTKVAVIVKTIAINSSRAVRASGSIILAAPYTLACRVGQKNPRWCFA